ncbi:MAG TPA: ribonuclease HII [Candidatus Latescibacteria bacterium]|nr:MAG: Ribonuclease HII [Candidatus Latescibacteria bacterium ADurb.Bin168]HPU85585.1 ribonuclease HII [Candidatus Latescibacterota bacterium]
MVLDPRTLRAKSTAFIREALANCGVVSESVIRAMEEDDRAAVRRMAERLKKAPRGPRTDMMIHEQQCWQSGSVRVAGVDEAGRGPLAGPVYAAAVILPRDGVPSGINDSKQLSAKRREQLDPLIRTCALAVHVASVDVEEIDRVNILQASLKAMRMAIAGLGHPPPDHVLVDGNTAPGSGLPETAIVDGDSKSVSIAAASILAKVARDRFMAEMDTRYPGYGFARNKGYGTREHLEALARLGPCPIHRRSFQHIACVSEYPTHSDLVAFFKRSLVLSESIQELRSVGAIIARKKNVLPPQNILALRQLYRQQFSVLRGRCEP